jgi:hypothetical protein
MEHSLHRHTQLIIWLLLVVAEVLVALMVVQAAALVVISQAQFQLLLQHLTL